MSKLTLFITTFLLASCSTPAMTGSPMFASQTIGAQYDTPEVVTTGEVRLLNNRRGAFRIYEGRNGHKASVTYAMIPTVEAAKLQTQRWIKLSGKITSKTQTKDKQTRVIGERAIAASSAAGQQTFAIIARSGNTCYLVESQSMEFAERVEALLQPDAPTGK